MIPWFDEETKCNLDLSSFLIISQPNSTSSKTLSNGIWTKTFPVPTSFGHMSQVTRLWCKWQQITHTAMLNIFHSYSTARWYCYLNLKFFLETNCQLYLIMASLKNVTTPNVNDNHTRFEVVTCKHYYLTRSLSSFLSLDTINWRIIYVRFALCRYESGRRMEGWSSKSVLPENEIIARCYWC